MPSEGDAMMLSTLRERVGADECYRRWTEELGRISVGTYGVSVGECIDADLTALDDGAEDAPDHASVDFSKHDAKAQRLQRARKLRAAAVARGLLYSP
jgi:hypothetical protein